MDKKQEGTITLALPLLLIVIIGAILVVLFTTGILKNPLTKSIQQLLPASEEPTVELQGQYQNPFDKNAQYVNPFARYKNPFDAL